MLGFGITFEFKLFLFTKTKKDIAIKHTTDMMEF